MRALKTLAGLVPALMIGVSTGASAQTAEVLHWWTSGGESAALGKVRAAYTAKGGTWKDTPIAGGGNARAAVVNRMIGGKPPTVFMFSIGKQLDELAEQGLVGDVNDVAVAGKWDAVLPPLIAQVSKRDGKYIAAPINIHGENWMFYNTAALKKAGVEVPKTWPDFLKAAKTLKAAGITPIALGGEPWQERILFNSVLLGVGGRDHYAKVYGQLDEAAMKSDTMLEVFKTVAALREFVDEGSPGRKWNIAANMMMKGTAAFQFMGDWAKGELVAAGIEPGTTVGCALAPAKDKGYIMTVDAFAFSNVKDKAGRDAQKLMASVIMDPAVQVAFNKQKGSIPVRTDVTDASFDVCAKLAMETLKDTKAQLASSGLFGLPSSVSGAIDDAISNYWNNRSLTPEQGRDLFIKAIASAK
ncbi:ABC transporter substrate-binding protein [Vitiosangium sp. GDMCC 1.1324]|uniref:ABC transporter substrate-binding protein n=1 Tax=Vitiosangium sp. (strain GDMCC 1.1324) TaxID=2138576 RepID=UPI000D3AC8EB|nr:ABC transporter substrate-binding protein [Vitiosangium sp. GDMCC 1.1324]PTL83728.1 carbohydrate ABC transporter substrate-binding protein [Vitiosangium sp. GDMCC 1.1324]